MRFSTSLQSDVKKKCGANRTAFPRQAAALLEVAPTGERHGRSAPRWLRVDQQRHLVMLGDRAVSTAAAAEPGEKRARETRLSAGLSSVGQARDFVDQEVTFQAALVMRWRYGRSSRSTRAP